MSDRCRGCDKEITDAEIPWCSRCAPEDDRAGTRYEDVTPPA